MILHHFKLEWNLQNMSIRSLGTCFCPEANIKLQKNGWIIKNKTKCSQTHKQKNIDFSISSNAKMSNAYTKGSKNRSRKWYGIILSDENFRRYLSLKVDFLCWFSIFFTNLRFLIAYISQSFHGTRLYHTIFLGRFLCSFHCCHLFLHLTNSEKIYF